MFDGVGCSIVGRARRLCRLRLIRDLDLGEAELVECFVQDRFHIVGLGEGADGGDGDDEHRDEREERAERKSRGHLGKRER